jgi:hypothetical protein
MAGAINAHNRIAGSTFGSVYARLRGKRCQPFNSDTKIRIHLSNEVRFYYPEMSVVGTSRKDRASFEREGGATWAGESGGERLARTRTPLGTR